MSSPECQPLTYTLIISITLYLQLMQQSPQKLNADWHELDAGHYPMLSHPQELAALLV